MSMFIEHEDIIGELKYPMRRAINLSSAPNEFLTMFLSAKISSSRNTNPVTIVPIIPNHTHNASDMSLIRNKTVVYTIVDEDDKYADLKISNLYQVMRIWTLGKIIIKTPMLPITEPKTKGITVVVITQHAPKSIRNNLAANDHLLGDLNNIAVANLMVVNNALLSGTSGLKWYLWHNNVEYREHIVNVNGSLSWLLLPKNKITSLDVADKSTVIDTIPEDDKRWQHRAGYTTMIYTNRGPKALIKKIPPTNTFENIVLVVVKRFYKCIKTLFIKVLSLFRKKRTRRSSSLLFSPVTNTFPYVYSIGAFVLSKSIKENAENDIDDANDMIARWQINRVAQKPTASRDKTQLLKHLSKTTASYIVGALGFNIQDAAMTADIKAAEECLKMRTRVMLLNMIVCIICCVIYGSISRIPIIMLATMVTSLTAKHSAGILLSAILSPTIMVNKLILISIFACEVHPGISNTLKKRILPLYALGTMVAQIITGVI